MQKWEYLPDSDMWLWWSDGLSRKTDQAPSVSDQTMRMYGPTDGRWIPSFHNPPERGRYLTYSSEDDHAQVIVWDSNQDGEYRWLASWTIDYWKPIVAPSRRHLTRFTLQRPEEKDVVELYDTWRGSIVCEMPCGDYTEIMELLNGDCPCS